MEFVVKLYRKQLNAGRVFLHENPAHASSWALPVIRKMMAEVGVDVVETDQCMFGLKTWGNHKHQLVPAKKPTKFMTNSRAIGNELRRRCDKSHLHQPLVDGRAKDAARYPPAMCKAICRGIVKEKMQRRLQVRAVLEVGEGVHKRVVDTEEFHDEELIPGSPVVSGFGAAGDSFLVFGQLCIFFIAFSLLHFLYCFVPIWPRLIVFGPFGTCWLQNRVQNVRPAFLQKDSSNSKHGEVR